MKYGSYKLIPIALCSLLVACSGDQDEELDQEIVELIEAVEEANQEVDKDRNVEVFTKEGMVNGIRFDIQDLESLQAIDKESRENIADKYVAGDESVKEELIAALLDEFYADKEALFWSLDPWMNSDFRITDRNLIKAIEANLYSLEHELLAINLMADQKTPGYIGLFEDRLYSGESGYEANLVLRLGQDGTSYDALIYVERQLERDAYENADLNLIMTGLNNYRERGNQRTKNKVDELVWYIYDEELISQRKYDKLMDDYDYGSPATKVLTYLFKYGEERAEPIAKTYMYSKALASEALECLVRFNGEEYRKLLVKDMKYRDTYMGALSCVPTYYQKTNDLRIIRSAITSFERLYCGKDKYSGWELGRLADGLIAAVGDQSDSLLQVYGTNDKFVKEALVLVEYKQMNLQETANYFYEIGLLENPMTEAELSLVVDEDYTETYYDLLHVSDIYFWYDSEDFDFQSYYNDYFGACLRNSLGYLDGIEYSVDIYNDDKDEVKYLAVMNDTAYRMIGPKYEDWNSTYFGDMVYFLNYILTYRSIEKQFHEFGYDEYIFGTGEAVETFKIKFNEKDV